MATGKMMKPLAMLILAGILSGVMVPKGLAEENPAVTRPVAAYVDPAAHYPVDVYDPWERFNRGVYRFNYYFDHYFFLPVVRGYEFVTPEAARRGITNFFSNLNEPRNFVNSLLQGRAESCVKAVLRLALNTTLGLGGLLDPAAAAGYPQQNEDFGQTLGLWGLGPGPYLVLPLLGPSGVRDAGGLAADTAFYSWWSGALIEEVSDDSGTQDAIRFGLTALNAVNTRSNVKFRYYETGSPFEYELVRFLYHKKREFDIRY
jgi:phospholipid-binding lipoprotein MlaA